MKIVVLSFYSLLTFAGIKKLANFEFGFWGFVDWEYFLSGSVFWGGFGHGVKWWVLAMKALPFEDIIVGFEVRPTSRGDEFLVWVSLEFLFGVHECVSYLSFWTVLFYCVRRLNGIIKYRKKINFFFTINNIKKNEHALLRCCLHYCSQTLYLSYNPAQLINIENS